jgi:hypothetical protein
VTAYDVDEIKLVYDIGGVDLMLEGGQCVLTGSDGSPELLMVKDEPQLMANWIAKELIARTVKYNPRVDRKVLDLFMLIIYDKIKSILSFNSTEISVLGGFDAPLDKENSKKYRLLKSKLSEIYGCCQICNKRTPSDENNMETMETIKSLVCQRGGMFPTKEPTKYSLGNGLFLCPTHQVLMIRGLVRFPGIMSDSDPNKMVSELSRGIEKFKALDKDEEVTFRCEVFEGVLRESKWTIQDSMIFRAGHLVEVLENIRSYYQWRLDNEER